LVGKTNKVKKWSSPGVAQTDLKTHKLPDKSPTTKAERREKRENGIKNSSFFYVYWPNR